MALIPKNNLKQVASTKGSGSAWGRTKSPFNDTHSPTFEPIRAPGVFIRKGATASPFTPSSVTASPTALADQPVTRPPVAVLPSETAPPFAIIAAEEVLPAPASNSSGDNRSAASVTSASTPPAQGTMSPFSTAGGIPMPIAASSRKSSPMSVPTFVRLFKLSISAAIIL
jgi:hypothetical protein